tara:strand:- start:6 stop:971 length:966 start_codon:yes stop_codon:yes gene_type:complete
MTTYFNYPEHDPYYYKLPDTEFLIKSYRNREKEWEGDMDKYFYKETKKRLKRFVQNWRFINEPITYRTNSDGFRHNKNLDEVDWKNTYAIVGCSYIYGQAMPEHLTVSGILTNEYNMPTVNLGIPGASNTMIHSNAINVMKKYKPKNVIILWSHLSRNTWITDYDKDSKHWNFELADHKIRDKKLMIGNVDDLKKKGYPSEFMKEVYTPNTVYEYLRYKDIHNLLGHLQFSIPESSHRTHKETLNLLNLVKPKDETYYRRYEKFYGRQCQFGFDLYDPELFPMLNNMYARDPIWHDRRLSMGHWGEVILRDMADLIHRTIK